MNGGYRVNDQPVDEAAFYAAACDPQRSVVVEACAGAGKTWMLVSRLLRALLDGAAPEQVLAITFTRKAAGEMRQRLDDWLREFSAAHSSHEQRVQALCLRGVPPAQAAVQAETLGGLRQRLLQSPRTVEIRTFHAWFAQLAGQLPLQLRAQLGLPASPALLEDVTPLRPALMRRFQRRVWADAALRDDHDQLVRQHRRSAVEAWLDTAWLRGEELALADAAGVLATSMPDAASVDPRCAGLESPLQRLRESGLQQRWRAVAQDLGAQKGVRARDAGAQLGSALDALPSGDPGAMFKAVWQAVFTKEGEPRKALGDAPPVQALVDDLRLLAAARDQQQAFDDHQRMLRLSRVLRDEWTALKQRQSLVDMPDLERAALALLSDPLHADWVQQRLDLRLQHLLIDEFQDTSPLQWHALYGWLSAYAGAGGGASGQRPPALFIVGDPKQSIYRFRRAEPRVFEAARDFVVHGLDGQVLACDRTRRNAPAVVAALNAVFADAAQHEGWGPFRAHDTASTAAGAALALPGIEREPRSTEAGREGWRDSLTTARHEAQEHLKLTEARQVADAIAERVAQGQDPGQVMVLARQRVMLHRVAEALAERGLPCVMPEPLPLAASPEAQDLVALLDVLASPGHDLSLARALKSPVFGCSDADLLQLAQAARAQGRLWLPTLMALKPTQVRARDAAESSSASSLYELALSSTLQRAQRLLAAWLPQVAESTPHELLDRICDQADVEARLLAAVPPPRRQLARQALRGLLRAALDHDGGRFVSIYGFVRAVRQGRLKASPPVLPAAVQLLTVHGAKGLEADVVFIVDADGEQRRAPRSTLLVDWPVTQPVPRRVAFVASESRLPPALTELLAREQREREREELNGLYVAMTRARLQLVVSHTQPFRPVAGRSWWQRLAPQLLPWAPEPAPVVAHATEAAPGSVQVEQLPVLAPPAAVASSPADAAAEAALDPRAAALGRAVHRLLEWIGQPGLPLPRAAWPAAARQAVTAFGLPVTEADAVLALATRIADSPDCARFFSGPGLRWAGNEVPVSLQGQLLRVDRLVQTAAPGATGAQWWVLDYKLRHTPQQLLVYQQQLQAYRQAVQQALADPGATVHAGFITGAGRWVEV